VTAALLLLLLLLVASSVSVDTPACAG
jgi:hypothetical protein